MSASVSPINARGDKLVVVCGATGKQGGAVVRHLLLAGFRVRGLTRATNSDAVRALAQRGVEMVACDFNTPASLTAALAGAYGVFSVQNYYEKGVGYDGEVRQGCALADAAKAAGVEHVVQSTMATAVDAEAVHHFRSKFRLERYIDEIGLSRTFLGTVWFMDNLYDPKMGGETNFAVIAGTLGRNRPFEMMAVDDLGAITAAVFEDRERFVGQKINIAGDRKTVTEMRAAFQDVIGRAPPGYGIPNVFMRLLHSDIAGQLRWQKRVGWSFPLSEAGAVFPLMQDFQTFLRNNRDRFKGA
jgi:uncharacterized protein YbjT (DUF2867 family)